MVKETAIKMLKKELSTVKSSPVECCEIIPDEKELKWEVLIAGPPETPYEGGTFSLEIIIPKNYPNTAPDFRFVTPIFHPNIDDHGKFCMAEIKEEWTQNSSIINVLPLIVTMIRFPDKEATINKEASKLLRENIEDYNKKAKEFTLKYAIE